MSCRNIAKIFSFVTILLPFCLNVTSCGFISSKNSNSPNQNAVNSEAEFSADYQKPKIVGTIASSEISESSGLAASGCNKNTFWTHNDSGDDAFIYAFNSAGEKLGTWRVAGAKNDDWEDIAAYKNADGVCYLYIGDIGNNTRDRREMTIYKIKEPLISGTAGGGSNRKNPLLTKSAEAVRFEYPDVRRDAESLLVHPQTGDIYILSKSVSGASAVYKLAAQKTDADNTNEPEKIADLRVPAMPDGFLTGAAISPDGKRVAVCDYFSGYEIVLPENAENFDEIWKQKPVKIELGARTQGESIAYSSNGKSIFATSEKRNSPIIKVDRK